MITITCWIVLIPRSRVSEATTPAQPAATSARHIKATGNRDRDIADRTTSAPNVTGCSRLIRAGVRRSSGRVVAGCGDRVMEGRRVGDGVGAEVRLLPQGGRGGPPSRVAAVGA